MPSSSSGGGGGRDSRRSSKSGASGNDAYRTSERKEKAKSSASYTAAAYGASRRGSVQPTMGTVPERPRMKSRNNSAPLIATREQQQGSGQGQQRGQEADGEEDEEDAAQMRAGAMVDGQDEDEVAGVVGAARQYQPFQSPEVSEPLPEINIAVIGAEEVGKSTFIQRALGLPHLPPSQAAVKKFPVDGSVYLVRLLELPINDVDVDDETVTWPDAIEDLPMPKVDGAITLYDISDKETLKDVPGVLNAIRRASLPSVLISAKCDTPPSEREVDPMSIERNALRSFGGISVLQTSENSLESHKSAMATILKSIILGMPGDTNRTSLATRRRAQSNASRPVSPRPPAGTGHARASSEFSLLMQKDPSHARHDSSLAGYGSSTQLKVPKEASHEDMHRSFYHEESASEDGSTESAYSQEAAESVQRSQTFAGAAATTPTTASPPESGAGFEELVDRLLAPPMQPMTSKQDTKFVAVFLALYRKFAAPGRLLEAIAERFDALEQNGSAMMTVTRMQLQYLEVMDKWVGQYPGDFAHPRTKRRMQTFITKISQTRIHGAAAKEMVNHLESATEDDDTNWTFPDKDREVGDRSSKGSRSSTLIDDPSALFDEHWSGTTLGEISITSASDGTVRSSSGSSISSSQIMANAEAAQKAAALLRPTGKRPITKDEWRMLMNEPDALIARELTRMDWIMFSSIRPRDLVRNVASTSERAKYKNLLNVARMSEHFNRVAVWVSNYVLFRDKPKHRALMLEKFMRIARKLRELNNYNSLGAIIAGMKSSSVGRLGLTRDLIPTDAGKDWLKLEILMGSSRSYAAYRMAWENTNGERIPYLPLHLRDLASAEMGNATLIGPERDGRVNWRKFEVMGDVVVGIQRAQGTPYKGLGGGKGEVGVRELVLDVRLEEEDALYERSLRVEPAQGAGGASEKLRQLFKR
ncbi:hypothetical protein LTR78_004997 [Recurvomyces mirabilis]|uniref:Ras GEF n=1 Tax=Recurvomyces mirabilis TaxID=574656 RepID=A0AAE0WNQ8_9PEZI|nr:hypothetical protein LTR78_004997 [Recurvomyces mirabilis]KAK5158387.1 hypothetical protein LTS14_003405 [Recurvomyces mirabilis]